MTTTIAWYVSPHGFGHAARSCAILEELSERSPETRVVIHTTAPRWFFDTSLQRPFEFVPCDVDVGLIQASPMVEDLPATLDALGDMPWTGPAAEAFDRTLAACAPDLVVADISPFALAAAARLGVPSVLVENFTWDWIYLGYADEHPRMVEVAERIEALFAAADLRIQATPVCERVAGAAIVDPIARAPRNGRAVTRRALGVGPDEPMVLLSMGGIPWRYGSTEMLERNPAAVIVAPGTGDRLERRGQLVRLPHRSDFFHPDLMLAADAVVGKLGYSTIAEAWLCCRPYGWVLRDRFREGPALEPWVRRNVGGFRFESTDLASGDWIGRVVDLLGGCPGEAPRCSGAGPAAERIAAMLRSP